MTTRRLLGVMLALLSFVGMAVVAHRPKPRIDVAFSSLLPPSMPFVPAGPAIETSWFCPGMPSGGNGLQGVVHLVNPTTAPLSARVTAFAVGAAPVTKQLDLPIGADTSTSLTAMQPSATYVSALVEIDGGGAFVEQQADHPAGNTVAACANSTSSALYLPEGFTADTSTETLLITNPFPADAKLDISLITTSATLHPAALQSFRVPAESIAAVPLDQFALNEPAVATRVDSARGRVVVGRAQHYLGAGRLGVTVSLGVPSLVDQTYFADGESGDGITERYSIFNGSDDDVSVTAVFLGVPPSPQFANDTTIDVAAGEVATLDTKDVAGLPAGRHSLVLSTLGVHSIAVERAITRTTPDGPVTSVVAGAPPSFAVTRWSMAVGPSLAVDDTLVVLNVDNVEATVTVKAVTPAGNTAVAGLENVPLPAAGVIALTVPAASIGKPLILESSQRVFVERLLPRGGSLRGRSGSFALAG